MALVIYYYKIVAIFSSNFCCCFFEQGLCFSVFGSVRNRPTLIPQGINSHGLLIVLDTEAADVHVDIVVPGPGVAEGVTHTALGTLAH